MVDEPIADLSQIDPGDSSEVSFLLLTRIGVL